MKSSNFNHEERTFSFSEIANELGISEEDLIWLAKQEGLLDENGFPTDFAISEGLLAIEPDLDAF
jgi:orotate phosphoribosyltransferase-like protein